VSDSTGIFADLHYYIRSLVDSVVLF